MFDLFNRTPTIRNVFETKYRKRRLVGASQSTLKAYRVTFNLFDGFIGKPARLSDLNNETVGGYQEARLRDVRPNTVKRDTDVLLAIWRWCCKQGTIKEWPDLAPLRASGRTPTALTESQAHAVWQSIHSDDTPPVVISCSPYKDVPGRVWWNAIALAAFDTAERFTPIFELTESNLSLEDLWIRFPAEDRKGKVADNLRPITQQTADAIAELLGYYERRNYRTRVFRWALNKGSVWPALGKIMVRAGLPDDAEFKFHILRKTHASHLTKEGGDAQRALGHLDPRTTERSYIDPRVVNDGRNQLAKLFRPGA